MSGQICIGDIQIIKRTHNGNYEIQAFVKIEASCQISVAEMVSTPRVEIAHRLMDME